jgi:multidrug resistance efflux pump
LAVAIIAVALFVTRKHAADSTGTIATAKRAPMNIVVLEGGTSEAHESQEIKCEVKGDTKILSIVDEGYYVTPEDVGKGLVLVELDSKKLRDSEIDQELQFQTAKAGYADARARYEIQVSQSASDLKAAQLVVKFALMDLERYLGTEVMKKLFAELGLQASVGDLSLDAMKMMKTPPEKPADKPDKTDSKAGERPENKPAPASEGNADAPKPSAEEAGHAVDAVKLELEERKKERGVDFAKYANVESLGDGEAQQKLRGLEDALMLAERELGLANITLEGTKRLYDSQFVTKNDLDNDEMGAKRKEIARDAAETSKQLYIKYGFLKEAETYLSGYVEAVHKLDRAKEMAISALAQAEVGLNSAEIRLQVQERQLNEVRDQISKCTIRAKKPGLVAYGGNDPWGRDDRIIEGAPVRERQTIITIPDTTQMDIKVKVHESVVKMVKKDQKVNIHFDAYPQEQLTGIVQKISVLPDSQNRWMNPDMKIYTTVVAIDGKQEWIKPGMSAECEIIIEEIPDVLQVPMQAVSVDKGEQVCFARVLGGLERRVVQPGRFNDSFVEIVSGLKEGDVVVLRAPTEPDENPDADSAENGKDKGKDNTKGKDKRPEKGKEAAPK